MIVDLIQKILGQKDDYSIKEKKNVNTRRLVARVASGNVSLQLGNFITQEQVDAQRERLSRFNFKIS